MLALVTLMLEIVIKYTDFLLHIVYSLGALQLLYINISYKNLHKKGVRGFDASEIVGVF